jgi:hypothetical protein
MNTLLYRWSPVNVMDRFGTPNKPDAANRRQPLGFWKPVGESGALAFTAAVADPFR